MQRNSTTLFLESPGAITPVPWVNGTIDVSAYTDPTLSVLLNSFNDYIANGGVIEVIPDPEPIIETSPPNWDGLYQALMVSSVYPTLVGIGQQISAVDGALDKTIDAIQYGIFKSDSVAAIPAFQSAINLLLYVLTNNDLGLSTEQLLEVRQLLDINGFTSIQLG